MLQALLLTAVVLAAAVMFWPRFRRFRSVLGLEHLVSTGHAFLILGYLLGLTFGERPSLTLDLAPIVGFIAGWVGFATGMRFDARVLRPVPSRAFGVALLPAIAAAVAVGGTSAALLWLTGAPIEQGLAACLVLAAAAATSGPTLAAVLRVRRAGRAAKARATLRMIEFSAGVDDLLVILLAVLAFALFRSSPEPIALVWIIALALGGGGVLGMITWLFLGGPASDDERLLLGLAMMAFIAGYADWLYLSPAGVAAIAAMVLVNLPGERMALLLRAVQRVERPAVVILMTMIGLHVSGEVSWLVLPLIIIMTAVRLMAKYAAGAALSGPMPGAAGLSTTTGWAFGLVPQGTLGLVVALSFYHVWHGELARTVLAAVAASSLINELMAPWLVLRVLRPMSTGNGKDGHDKDRDRDISGSFPKENAA